MYAQFFGNYLLSHGITKEQLMHAMQEANNEHPKLGTLAMHAGYMSASEVDRVIIMQTHEDKRFGELAIREGYLTEAQVTELLQTQNPNFLLLGQALLNDGVINNEQLQSLIIGYQSENELYDADMSAETKDIVDHLVENFFVIAERPLSPGELSFISYLTISFVLSGMIFHRFALNFVKNIRQTIVSGSRSMVNFPFVLISICRKAPALHLHPVMSMKIFTVLTNMYSLLSKIS